MLQRSLHYIVLVWQDSHFNDHHRAPIWISLADWNNRSKWSGSVMCRTWECKPVRLSFWPFPFVNQDRVGVHQPLCVIPLPSPAASPMPHLVAHCLHTSIKPSIFFCSTPVLLSTHLSCFAPPPPRSSAFKCVPPSCPDPCGSFILTQPVSLLTRYGRNA